MNSNYAQLPPEIASELRKYRRHRPGVTCPECGYHGVMGIDKAGGRPVVTLLCALLATGVAAGFGWGGLLVSPAILGASLAFFWHLTSSPLYSCPACKRYIEQ